MIKRIKFFSLALCMVLLLSSFQSVAQQNGKDTYYYLDVFGSVFEKIRGDYVEEISDEALIEAAIQGMLSSLDPHSSYLSPDQYQRMRIRTQGKFGGLGMEVTKQDDLILIVAPIDDTPAFRAGLKSGDLITHIDGESVLSLSLQEAVRKMRGPVNTQITLTIRRITQQQTETFDVTLTRMEIKITSVRSRIVEDVGYLRIRTFSQDTSTNLAEEMSELREQAATPLKGVILDLRNNPGGLLDEAIAVSDAFLNQGEIVSTRGRTEAQNNARYNATPGDITEGLPMVVLINRGSASASEIVAGALQDHKRALVVGTTSFGKGSVQRIMPINNHDGAIRITTSRYYTPSGRSIQQQGVIPDIHIPQARITPIEETRKGESDKPGALENEGLDQVTPPTNTKQTSADDYQFTRAIELLQSLWLFNQLQTQ